MDQDRFLARARLGHAYLAVKRARSVPWLVSSLHLAKVTVNTILHLSLVTVPIVTSYHHLGILLLWGGCAMVSSGFTSSSCSTRRDIITLPGIAGVVQPFPRGRILCFAMHCPGFDGRGRSHRICPWEPGMNRIILKLECGVSTVSTLVLYD